MRTGAKPVHGVAMEEDNQKKLLKQVIGGSSSSDSDTDEHANHLSQSTTNPSFMWERIDPIKGFWFCRDFLSSQQQFSLLSSIHTEGWLSEAGHNQAMRFGDLPIWALDLSDQIHEVVCFGDMEPNSGKLNLDSEPYVLPSQLLSRDPFFDQLIVNVYQPDGIAIVSLESSCVMHFSPGNGEVPLATKIPVYLTPGSLVIMWEDARYHWKHEINRKPEFQLRGCRMNVRLQAVLFLIIRTEIILSIWNAILYFPCNTSQVVVDNHVKRYYINGLEDKIVCPYTNFTMLLENFRNTINTSSFVSRLDDAAFKKKEVEKNVVDQSGQEFQESYENSCTDESKNDEAKCLGSLHQDSNAPLKNNKKEQKDMVINQSRQECHGCRYENNHTDGSENERCCYKDWLVYHDN
uniref:Uncharacterized protein n=1 Tax=Chenopodium quinoa TaxID=63459 RepID=A0A803MPH0_CHEQI